MATADSTRLEAVNRILSANGYSRTSDLASGRKDVRDADAVLSEVDRLVQAEGWYFNRDRTVTFSPNADGEIVFPGDVLRADSAEPPFRTGVTISQTQDEVIKRGNRLYNLTDRTFVFSGNITLDLVRMLDFEDLPEEARSYITARAAREFATRYGLDQQRRNALAEEEMRARSVLLTMEAAVSDSSFLDAPTTRDIYRR